MNGKIERDFLVANLAEVDRLLAGMTDSDFLTRMSLESHRDEIRETLVSGDAATTPQAQAAPILAALAPLLRLVEEAAVDDYPALAAVLDRLHMQLHRAIEDLQHAVKEERE